MAFIKIIIHAVWSTKYRQPVMTNDIRGKIIHHIRENARIKDIYIDRINGYTDHLHCLMRLNTDMSIAKAMQLIKGESAFWANKEKITETKFEWANEYYAASVSESALQKVRDYIDGQEKHHHKRTFQQECAEFLDRYGIKGEG
ncbi:MAG TPA: IS200/IS605 family transposase [Bacteroidia bacterium]|nr:IS200/IS605 family transposase [Bacteroidia bacterium]HMU19482.1 IS200/IS605 family transposase [Bacteroidia bacterium]